MSYTRALFQRSSKNWRSFSPPPCPSSLLCTTRQLFPSASTAKAFPSLTLCSSSSVFRGVPDELSTGDTSVTPKCPQSQRRPHLTHSRSFSDFSSRSGTFHPLEVAAGEYQSPHRLYASQQASLQVKVKTPYVRLPSAPPSSRVAARSKIPFANDGRGLELVNRYARVPTVFNMIGNFSCALPPQRSGGQPVTPHEKQPPPSAHQDSSPDQHAHALQLEENEPIGAYAGDAAATATANAPRKPHTAPDGRGVEHEASTFPVPPPPPPPTHPPTSAVPPSHPQARSSPKTTPEQPQTSTTKISSFSSAASLSRVPYPWDIKTEERKEVAEEVSSGWSLSSVIRQMSGYLRRKRSREDNELPQNDAFFSQMSSTKIRRKENESSVYDVVTSPVAGAGTKEPYSTARYSHGATQPSAKMEEETDAMYSSWEDPLLKVQEKLLRHRPADELPHAQRRLLTRDTRQLGMYGIAEGGRGQDASYSNDGSYSVAPTPPPPPPPPSPPPPPPPPYSQFPVAGYSRSKAHFDFSADSLGTSERTSQEEEVFMARLPKATPRSHVGASFYDASNPHPEDVPQAATQSNFGAVAHRGAATQCFRNRRPLPLRCSSGTLAIRSSGVTGRMRTLRRERKCLGHGGAPRTDLVTFFSMAAVRKEMDSLGPGSDSPSTVAAGYSFSSNEQKEGYSPYASYAIRSSALPLSRSTRIAGKGDTGFGWRIDASANGAPSRVPTAALSSPDVSAVELGDTRYAYTKAETYAFARSGDGSVYASASAARTTFTRRRSLSAADGRAALVAFAERLSRAAVEAGTIDPSDPANPCSYPQSSQWNHMEAGRVI